jgi:4-oxalocrotonate tautomerase family enzyme
MMPTIEAFIAEGYSHRQKQEIIGSMTHAVVASIDAPIDSVRVILNEVGAHDIGIGGVPVAAMTSPETGQGMAPSVVQAFLIAGRSDEQKRRLIAALTDVLADLPGAARSAVRIIIKDIPNTDFGLAGKTAQSLGRGVGRSAMEAARMR